MNDSHLYPIQCMIQECIFKLYSSGCVGYCHVIDSIGIEANLLKARQGLVEYAIYAKHCALEPVPCKIKLVDVLGSAITSSRGRPFSDHLSIYQTQCKVSTATNGGETMMYAQRRTALLF